MPLSKPSILIITTSAGNGHIQAAEALRSRFEAHATVYTIDILQDWSGMIGRGIIWLWNISMRFGLFYLTRLFSEGHMIVDPLFSYFLYKKLRAFINHSIDVVIDTQILGFTGLIEACIEAQAESTRPISFEKQLVELPTKYADIYFSQIRSLSPEQRSIITLYTEHPMLEPSQTEQSFWTHYTQLSPAQINYTRPPIHPAFLEPPSKIIVTLPLPMQKECVRKEAGRWIDADVFEVATDQPIITIMLGSQVSIESLSLYVKAIPNNWNGVIFLSLGNRSLEEDLVQMLLTQVKNHTTVATIIPLLLQSQQTIASLFSHSTILVTRSGGLTSHQLLHTARGKIYIHSESVHDPLQGMPSWEKGNFLYLQERKSATLITVAQADLLYQ